ncbi:hypothetical protein L8P27_16785 [Enterobacter asburiae]|uniref:hypothetical protein n=1 Tax=Enterobacter asburiae TaxID=61645 RepID=UPI0020033E7E|nr:hypothetical protein [Enterobacter asburiae]MCK7229466.1 hypothetical protein [Enterobacter asburiae]
MPIHNRSEWNTQLPYPEPENILADNTNRGDAHSSGIDYIRQSRNKNTGPEGKDTTQIMSSPFPDKYTIKPAQWGEYTGDKNRRKILLPGGACIALMKFWLDGKWRLKNMDSFRVRLTLTKIR